ncbi:uncharacterized protein A1O9_02575 [Exophiala aquamarina CBS 119918]|uniref:Epoxide hydrolase N-terminal domain-containing protein n=1 Tax=Exophiala aquamarina CBS 119918 TaxID=1182545 RepID=A0A072PMA3_9EURO|nr:uncharacterized protein A1O9_02575 [Exophiala aquamarina CBS 119918]KEF61011.1 hypothetical protein A1O9_02575 [Exophiala aquamarina CBS 119918]
MANYGTVPEAAQLRPLRYHLEVPDRDISDFKDLLRISRLAPKTYENLQSENNYGVTHEWMSKAKEYWLTKYDWRQRETYINSFPNFKVDIEDDGETFQIHFAALFSKKQDAIPLLFMHGWPGRFLEFLSLMDIIRKRYSPEELPYHIIVPSLPGYTLSSGPPLTKSFNQEDVARIMNKLMVGLGFGAGYVAQGGDVGSFECRILNKFYDECKVNFSMMWTEPAGVDPKEVNDEERAGVERMQRWMVDGSAYSVEHRTRPATIGFALAASPLSLLAWVGEKFIEWSDETPPLDEILDDVTLYWFTETFPRCIYPYRPVDPGVKELAHSNPKYRCSKPVGYSWFPRELGPMPRAWVEKQGNLVWYRQHNAGGHFAALERPKVLVQDVEDFVKQVWPVI